MCGRQTNRELLPQIYTNIADFAIHLCKATIICCLIKYLPSRYNETNAQHIVISKAHTTKNGNNTTFFIAFIQNYIDIFSKSDKK